MANELPHSAAAPPDDSPPLAANRDFKIVLGGQSISALGDAVSFTATPLLVLALTGTICLAASAAARGSCRWASLPSAS